MTDWADEKARGILRNGPGIYYRSDAVAQALRDERERADRFEKALQEIDDWAKAYPLAIFPEPDFNEAARVLRENGMTLDAISASNMRHVLSGVQKIIATVIRTEGE